MQSDPIDVPFTVVRSARAIRTGNIVLLIIRFAGFGLWWGLCKIVWRVAYSFAFPGA